MRVPVLACAAAALMVAAACGDQSADLLSPTAPRLLAGPTTRVSVTCPDTMEVDQSAQCTAYGFDAHNVFTGQNATWSTDAPWWVLTVSSSGVVTARGEGTATVYATIDGITGSTTIRVIKPLGVFISGQTEVPANTQCAFVAVASGGKPPYSYSWSALNATGSTNSDGYMWTGESPGPTFTLSVTVTDANNESRSASHTVTTHNNELGCLLGFQ